MPVTTAKITPRLKERYQQEIAPALEPLGGALLDRARRAGLALVQRAGTLAALLGIERGLGLGVVGSRRRGRGLLGGRLLGRGLRGGLGLSRSLLGGLLDVLVVLCVSHCAAF